MIITNWQLCFFCKNIRNETEARSPFPVPLQVNTNILMEGAVDDWDTDIDEKLWKSGGVI